MKKLKFIVIFGLLLIFLSSFVYADLDTGLINVFKFENDGNDTVSSYDLSNFNTPDFTATGIDGGGVDLENTEEDYLEGTTDHWQSGTLSRTFNIWVKVENDNNENTFVIANCDSEFPTNGNSFDLGINDANNKFMLDIWNTDIQSTETVTYPKDWTMLTAVVNDTDDQFYLYVNGVKENTGTMGSTWSALLSVGSRACSGATTYNHWDGVVDEFYIWNRTLLSSEITELYNSGTGTFCSGNPCTFGSVTPPQPSLTIYTNLTSYINWTETTLTFNYSGDVSNADSDLVNITFTQKSFYNNTKTTTVDFISGLNISNNNIYNITFPTDIQGWWNITINASNQQINDSTIYYYFVDVITPPINVYNQNQLFINNTNFTKNLNTIINLNMTSVDLNLYYMNFSIFQYNGSEYNILKNYTEITTTGLTTATLNLSFDVNKFSNGSYMIDTFAADSHTKNAPIRNVSWTTSPDTINIDNEIYLEGDIKEERTTFLLNQEQDKYKFKITWNEDSLNHVLYIRSDDLRFIADSPYIGHFVSLKYLRWVDFINSNIKDLKITQIEENYYRLDIELYVLSDEIEFESIGDLNTNNKKYYFNINNGFSFTAKDGVDSTNLTTFQLQFFQGGTLIQNLTTTTGNLTTNLTGLYNITFNSTGYADNNTNNLNLIEGDNFLWTIFRANSLYLFLYDEETNTLITDTNITIELLGPNSAINKTIEDGSIFLSNFDTGEYEIRYGGRNGGPYRWRTYFTTITDASTQSIDLYTVKNATSSQILFSLTNEKGDPLFNHTLIGQRFFVDDNAYLTIGMEKTDQNGETGFYLIPNDVYYIFSIKDASGKTIFSGSPQKIFAQTVYIQAKTIDDVLHSYLQGQKTLTTSLVWNNATKSLTYTFSETTGLVVEGCLEVIERSYLTDTQIYINCVSTNSGTIIYNQTGNIRSDRTYIAKGFVEYDTPYSVEITDLVTDYITDGIRADKPSLFFSYIFIATMFLLGVPFNFSVALLYSILSMVVINISGYTFIGWTTITTLSIVGLIIAAKTRA